MLFLVFRDDFFNEAGYRQSRENDKIDSKYGFDRVKDGLERTGYLINMHTVSSTVHPYYKRHLHKIIQKQLTTTFFDQLKTTSTTSIKAK